MSAALSVERLQLVLALTEANAAQHRAQAAAGGAQMTVAALEERHAAGDCDAALEAQLDAAYAEDDAALDRLAAAEMRVDALSARLAALDRAMAAAAAAPTADPDPETPDVL